MVFQTLIDSVQCLFFLDFLDSQCLIKSEVFLFSNLPLSGANFDGRKIPANYKFFIVVLFCSSDMCIFKGCQLA